MMMSHRSTEQFQVLTRWRVDASPEEVADILCETRALPEWWPAAFLSATIIAPGGPGGVGQVALLHTKGWLPYTLRFLTEVHEGGVHGFTITVKGDFNGCCVCRARRVDGQTEVTFDWRIDFAKRGLRRLMPLFNWVFVANHRWSMQRGLESLRLEVARRRALCSGVAVTTAAPPGPTFRRFVRQPEA
jgi:hypothetical protein